jgi:two-component system, LytTR family, response regulator LytT
MTESPGVPNEGLRVLAVDDEPPALDELVYLLERTPGIAHVTAAGTASRALNELQNNAFDAVFLDIRMPGISGLDLARLVGRFAHPPDVVFVTAYEQHAVEAFDMAATDFLRKPIRAERLGEAVRRVAAKRDTGRASGVDQNDETIAVELAGRTSYIRRSTIVLVEATGDYVRLHTAAGSHLVRTPLSTLEERWTEAGFLRVHRRFLVNRHQVQGLRTSAGKIEIELNGGRVVPVSRRHTAAVRAALVGGHRIDREP